MTDLDKLIAAVEAGHCGLRQMKDAGISIPHMIEMRKAHAGSLDAAHRLHDALLPGWGWCAAADAHGEQWFSIDEPSGSFETEETYADNPARAWLLAILRALKAQGGDA